MRLFLIAFAATLFMAAPASAASQDLVVSQVYGGGGNTGASHTNDFIELFNRGPEALPLDGLSLQYASATGTGNFGASSTQLTELTGTIGAGRYFLVQEAGGTVGSPLPAADQTDVASPINMSGTAGKVALVTGTASLGCNGGSQACDATQQARIVDLVGYGTANFFEGTAPAPGLSNSTSAQRKSGGCVDTDDNAADFDAAATAPRNSGTPRRFCDADQAPAVSAQTPAAGASDVAQDADVTITFSEDVTTTGDWASVSCSSSGAHTTTVSGGPRSYTLDPDTDFAQNETCTVTVHAADVADVDQNDPPDTMEADKTWSFSTVAPTYRIHEIQGSSHVSPYAGQRTSFVPGVVTAVTTNGFWMQDPQPDGDPATSEGIFVFTSSKPTVEAGTAVTVSGEVSEFRPGGASTINLTTTELKDVTVYPGAAGAEIAPTVIGAGGRTPPNRVIEDDATGNVETSGVFDPQQDGIDFYESLEAMKVQVNDAVVVGPRNSFGEIWVVGDNGANAGRRTNRGGVVVGPDDFNPERVQLDNALAATPKVNVGDTIPGAIVGVLSYDFGNFELLPLTAPTAVSNTLERETTRAPVKNELEIASFNVENLAPGDPASKYAGLADTLVNNLQAPDIVAVEEIQDNSGASDNGVTDASATWGKLITAITAAGGPTYQYRQIDPVNDQDGGQPGGNIRQGFLFRTDRGLAFVDRPGGTSTNSTEVVRTRSGPQLTFSPGRIQPGDLAFTSSRKPLAGEFTWKSKSLIVVANHFNSKGGDDPLFGYRQPPVRVSEEQRHRQATIVNAFAREIQRADPLADYVVLGDLNDFEFSRTVQILQGFQMLDLYYLLPPSERYSYVFEGNSQALDHILVSPSLLFPLPDYDSVHVNSEFADQQSDHDPQVVRLRP